jgi:hypothetical protein
MNLQLPEIVLLLALATGLRIFHCSLERVARFVGVSLAPVNIIARTFYNQAAISSSKDIRTVNSEELGIC